MDELDGCVRLQQVPPCAFARMWLPGNEKHAQLVAHAVHRHRRLIVEGRDLAGRGLDRNFDSREPAPVEAHRDRLPLTGDDGPFARGFAEARRREGVTLGVTRIGVNTGPAVVGNFGGRRRFDYTAHGDAINTAARLEAANKALGTRVLVARATAERAAAEVAGEVCFRPVGALHLKGKTGGTEAFEAYAVGAGSGRATAA